MIFFKNVWQTPNQLPKAVSADLAVPEHLAGCKALGIINKGITGPLWRVLEDKDISILDMNGRFQNLLSCLGKWAIDASTVVSGNAIVFEDFPPTVDAIYECLFAPSKYDNIVEESLTVLFGAFSSLLTRLVCEHLPDGKYDATNVSLVAETKSVPKTNTISERDFAQLDRFLREKPNASILSLEALILFCNNKTASWLNDKSPAERCELLHKARSSSSGLKRQYQVRRKKLIRLDEPFRCTKFQPDWSTHSRFMADFAKCAKRRSRRKKQRRKTQTLAAHISEMALAIFFTFGMWTPLPS